MPSIALPVSLRGQLLYSTRIFDPVSLFAANEPGVWYDPSDVANLNWRRNLLTWTEQFDNAAWVTAQAGKSSTTEVVAAIANAPLWRITEDTATNRHEIRQNIPAATIGQNYVLTVYAKEPTSNSRRYLQVFSSFTNDFANFDLQSVTVTAGVGSITPIGSGVYRLQVPMLAASAGTIIYFALANSGTLARAGSYTGDGVSNLLITGAQLELGSTATEYQRITDVNTEVIERFPTATLYQDTAGTTPVTTPGQTVALALDKSKGLVLGPEQSPALPDYQTVLTGTWAASGANYVFTDTVGGQSRPGVQWPTISLAAGTYQLVVVVAAINGATQIRLDGVGATDQLLTVGSNTRIVSVTSTSRPRFRLEDLSTTIGDSFTITSISVKELPGFHATQATAASRPTYGIVPRTGRRNLLTRTEEFNDAVWTKTSVTVTPNVISAPDGTLTADLMTGGGNWFAQTSSGSGVANQTVTGSLWVYPPAGVTSLTIRIDRSGIAQGNQSIKTVTPETWQRVTHTATLDANTAAPVLRIDLTGGTTLNVWGAQLETGSTATAYQRVGSAFDVTEAGVASLSYLSFDGVDDFMVTPTITPGIDKAQVFAGVRKLSDAAQGMVVEASTNVTSGGAFNLQAPAVGPVETFGQFRFVSGGSVAAGGVAAALSGHAAPATRVIAGLADIAGDLATLRLNGSQAAQGTTDQGTGNFLAYPLYIGRRGGTLLPFNGNIFSLIVRFGTNLDAGTITSTETWVAGKTGVTL